MAFDSNAPSAPPSNTLHSICYNRGSLQLLDQRKLPLETFYLDIRDSTDGWNAIWDMVVRGAPAIAIAGALSLAVEVFNLDAFSGSPADAASFLQKKLEYLVSSRPTAVNLTDAATKLKEVISKTAATTAEARSVFQAYIEAAEIMLEDDVASNKAIGSYGASFIQHQTKKQKLSVLTHCNTGRFQSPPTNPTMDHGTSMGTSGGQSCEKEQETTSEFVTESQTPPLSMQVELYNITLDEEDQPTQKKQRARFTPEEDKVLIQSWLNVSKNAVGGVNQKVDSFWLRIKDNYNDNRGHLQARELTQVKCRWQKLNSIVKKFAGCYKQAYQRKKSGSSETDTMGDAYLIYYQDVREQFKLDHAWRLLKDEPKWLNASFEGASKRTKISVSGAYSSSSNLDTPSCCEYNPTSPNMVCAIGTKAAGRREKSKANETSYVDLTTTDERQKSKIAAIEEWTCAMLEHNKLKEKEFSMKEKELELQMKMKEKELEMHMKMKEKELDLQILFRDISGMTDTQVRDHERLSNIIREKYGIM